MEEWVGYMKGINLGGWLSQCNHTEHHYRTFIQEADFRVIHGWGCDHVRIPVDYELLEDNDGNDLEQGYSIIQNAIDWCKKNDLKMILDLHKTFGYSFDPGENESGFFYSKKLQERFYQLWEKIARHFGDQYETLSFELLNEVTDREYCEIWNSVADECIRRIRAISPRIFILVGGYGYNSVSAVKDLLLPPDKRIIYNFHCYEPMVFTHQGANWIPTMDPGFRISIRSTYQSLQEKTDEMLPDGTRGFESFPPDSMPDSSYFEELFAEAVSVAKERNVRLYCGEYGVIDRSDLDDVLAWYRMIHPIFEKYHIGRAAWSYKKMDFGISDTRMEKIRKDLIKNL